MGEERREEKDRVTRKRIWCVVVSWMEDPGKRYRIKEGGRGSEGVKGDWNRGLGEERREEER